MASVVVGLSLNSPTIGLVDLQRIDLNVFLQITEGLDELPTVRGSDDLVPFRTGRLPLPRWGDSRRLVLDGWIAGTAGASAPASFRGYVDSVKRALDPAGDEERVLVATLEDGTTRWIRCRPRNLMWGERYGDEARLVSVELEALDPYWYSPYGFATLDSGLFLDNGELLDQGAEIVVTPTSTVHDVPLTIPGTAECERVRVSLLGPSTAAVGVEVVAPDPIGFSHPALGELRLAGQAFSGERLHIDNHERTVALDGSTARRDLTLRSGNRHGEYLRLPPGTQTIRILGKPAEARLLFTPTWQ